MEAEEVENTLFSDESTAVDRVEAFFAWWSVQSDPVSRGQATCSITTCVLCGVLDAQDSSLQAEQFRLFLTVVQRRDPTTLEWTNSLINESLRLNHMPPFDGSISTVHGKQF